MRAGNRSYAPSHRYAPVSSVWLTTYPDCMRVVQGWIWEWTPAFIGCGLLVPMNSSASFVGGDALAWAIIGPALVVTGRDVVAVPRLPQLLEHGPARPRASALAGVLDDLAGLYALAHIKHCGDRCKLQDDRDCVQRTLEPLVTRVCRLAQLGERGVHFEQEGGFYDPVPPEAQTPWWMWMGGLVASTILTMLVMKDQFDQNPV